MNAYYMLTDLRDNIKESSEKHWGDNDLLRKLNQSHRRRANELISSPGDWLVTSTDLTPSNSVITLPSDCIKPVYMEEKTSGRVIEISGDVRGRRLTRLAGTTLYSGAVDAYILEDTLVINMDSFTDQVTLWYQRRIPDLHAGTAGTGSGSTTLVLESDNEPSLVDDYYNNAVVEVVSGTGAKTRTTISDYVGSTYTATTAAGTFSTDSVYGTVSELPVEADGLVVLDATLIALAKPGVSLDPKYFEFFFALWKDAKKDWNDFVSTRISGSNRTRVTEIE